MIGVPGFLAMRRRTIRGPVNPMDKSTIFSIYPKKIHEVHHTIQPGTFDIAPGTVDKPTCLVVGSSSWWKEIDEEQQLLEIPNGSVQVANAIVKGYCSGIFACNMIDAQPGLFWAPGNYTALDLKDTKEHADLNKLYKKAILMQTNWYKNVVRLTDGLWARTNGNPLVVSDDARLAASELGLSNKEWMRDFQQLKKINCVACGTPKDPLYPVCPACKHVDLAKAKELGLVFAIDTTPTMQQQPKA